MRHIYCTKCGHKLRERRIGDDDCQECRNCGAIYGDSPLPVVVALVVNEENEVLLLKQNHLSADKWGVVSGYVVDGETAEETVRREVQEETGQIVGRLQYISSYYFEPRQLIMLGFLAFVKKRDFAKSDEVDDLRWYQIAEIDAVIARENNCSGMLFDACRSYL